MKAQLLKLMAAHRALSLQIDALGVAWSADETVRNRPDRQALCGELCQFTQPLKFGRVVDMIAKSCGVDLI